MKTDMLTLLAAEDPRKRFDIDLVYLLELIDLLCPEVSGQRYTRYLLALSLIETCGSHDPARPLLSAAEAAALFDGTTTGRPSSLLCSILATANDIKLIQAELGYKDLHLRRRLARANRMV